MNRAERAEALGLGRAADMMASASVQSSDWGSRSISHGRSSSRASADAMRSRSRSVSRSRSRSPSPTSNRLGVAMEVLVDSEPLQKFQGPGEQGHEYEQWVYVVAVPGARYSLQFVNMEDAARDLVVEIKIDGVLQSKSYALPKHNTKVKHGKTDGSSNLWPWEFNLTRYTEEGSNEGGGDGGASGGAGDVTTMGTISAQFHNAMEVHEWDDGQVVVEESELSRKAKYTTAYGEPEYVPVFENNGGRMKRRLQRESRYEPPAAEIKVHYRDLDTLISNGAEIITGSFIIAGTAATELALRLHLFLKANRGIVSALYNPPWLADFRRQQSEQARRQAAQQQQQMQQQMQQRQRVDAAQTIDLSTADHRLVSGETIDLTE